MTEHPRRVGVKRDDDLDGKVEICNRVISSLQLEISQRCNGAAVSIRRGSIIETWLQFFKAKVLICSASTFCLWPALANENGRSFLPVTKLFGQGHILDFDVDNVRFIEDYVRYIVPQKEVPSMHLAERTVSALINPKKFNLTKPLPTLS